MELDPVRGRTKDALSRLPTTRIQQGASKSIFFLLFLHSLSLTITTIYINDQQLKKVEERLYFLLQRAKKSFCHGQEPSAVLVYLKLTLIMLTESTAVITINKTIGPNLGRWDLGFGFIPIVVSLKPFFYSGILMGQT